MTKNEQLLADLEYQRRKLEHDLRKVDEALKELRGSYGEEFQLLPEQEQIDQVFEFLDDLRESGVTNMYGAGPYVEKEFGVNSRDADGWVGRWMQSFNKRNA